MNVILSLFVYFKNDNAIKKGGSKPTQSVRLIQCYIVGYAATSPGQLSIGANTRNYVFKRNHCINKKRRFVIYKS